MIWVVLEVPVLVSIFFSLGKRWGRFWDPVYPEGFLELNQVLHKSHVSSVSSCVPQWPNERCVSSALCSVMRMSPTGTHLACRPIYGSLAATFLHLPKEPFRNITFINRHSSCRSKTQPAESHPQPPCWRITVNIADTCLFMHMYDVCLQNK